jgi:hypothetical protein
VSEFDNGTVGGADPRTAGGDAPRESVDLARSGFAHSYERHEERMAAPSHSDRAAGAPEATWADSTVSKATEGRPAPERAAEFGADDAMAALGLPQDTIAGVRTWMTGGLQLSEEHLSALDAQHEATAAQELRTLWGDAHLVANLKTIDAYLESLPDHAGVAFRAARDASGRALANDPATLQRLLGAAQSRQAVPLSGSLAQQIAAIEGLMRTDRTAYNRDALLQARYRELLTMRERAR